MTTLTLDATADPGRCTDCGARATSCDIRRWLSGRSCCDTCAGPRTHRDLVTHDPLEHVDHDDHNHVDHDDHVELSEGT